MCLRVKRFSRIKKAKKDITVYKFASKDDNYYRTPFMYDLINTNILLKIDEKIKKIKRRNSFIVEEGFHSFESYEDVRSYKYVFTCVIPKGSYYITGTYNNKKSIVSNQLIYKKLRIL